MNKHNEHYNKATNLDRDCIDKFSERDGSFLAFAFCELTADKYRDRIGFKDNTHKEVEKIKTYLERAQEIKTNPTNKTIPDAWLKVMIEMGVDVQIEGFRQRYAKEVAKEVFDYAKPFLDIDESNVYFNYDDMYRIYIVCSKEFNTDDMYVRRVSDITEDVEDKLSVHISTQLLDESLESTQDITNELLNLSKS